MSIHQGSCVFGSIDGSKGTGHDIVAISDKAHDYSGVWLSVAAAASDGLSTHNLLHTLDRQHWQCSTWLALVRFELMLHISCATRAVQQQQNELPCRTC